MKSLTRALDARHPLLRGEGPPRVCHLLPLPEDELAHVEGLFLQGRTLRFADFTKSRLYAADLMSADLQGALLEGVQLHGANLEWAQLQGANLQRAQLQGANLQYARLQSAERLGIEADCGRIGV